MQHPEWINQLIERAHIGIAARGLRPVGPTESVIGRLPRRLRTLYAAYGLQVERVKNRLIEVDQLHDYTRCQIGIDPIVDSALTHERNKMTLMYWVFWISFHEEMQFSGNIGIRQFWQIVRVPAGR